jgi:hypothetical protein
VSYWPPAMKTRRKSYQDVEGEATSSQVAEEREESILSISPDFDIDYLTQHFPHIEDWTRPSAATISQVYTTLVEILKERDVAQESTERLQAELERKEVELDQSLQDRENETKELEASLESAKNERGAALEERDQLGALCFVLLPQCTEYNISVSGFASLVTGRGHAAI